MKSRLGQIFITFLKNENEIKAGKSIKHDMDTFINTSLKHMCKIFRLQKRTNSKFISNNEKFDFINLQNVLFCIFYFKYYAVYIQQNQKLACKI